MNLLLSNQGTGLVLFFLLGAGVILVSILLNRKAWSSRLVNKAIQEIAGETKILYHARGYKVNCNHPLLGTAEHNMALVITEKFLGLISAIDGSTTRIPLEQIKARVMTGSPSSTDIWLNGMVALAIPDRLLVLEINDPLSRETYTCAFKDVMDKEAVASQINRQRYLFLTTG